ncbi:unnamed protein product [Urochloa decumbens]|uniref:BTB domain-containing protein n=1 Tax=Urochloa decumbens TaxID=240449 RepID=A0ABC9BLW7_9POAL
MPASQRPTTRTESTCTMETAQGTHAFRIVGYSLQKGIGRGKFIRSANFAVGGYDWAIRFYPDGESSNVEDDNVDAEVRALYDFQAGQPRLWAVVVGVLSEGAVNFLIPSFGYPHTAMRVEVQVPPPELQDNLGKLLESEESADVTFKVKGEVILDHRVMLALRSPVFKAELYGPLSGKKRQIINVEDVEPSVFKALLHFIYTDSLPAMDDLDADENGEMVKHLLVAADRYGVDRMKLICESILCKRLDVEGVATTLALADQYHCNKLKDACIGFINSLNRMDDVLSSQGYAHLKRDCPAVFVDIFEKTAKSHKI